MRRRQSEGIRGGISRRYQLRVEFALEPRYAVTTTALPHTGSRSDIIAYPTKLKSHQDSADWPRSQINHHVARHTCERTTGGDRLKANDGMHLTPRLRQR